MRKISIFCSHLPFNKSYDQISTCSLIKEIPSPKDKELRSPDSSLDCRGVYGTPGILRENNPAPSFTSNKQNHFKNNRHQNDNHTLREMGNTQTTGHSSGIPSFFECEDSICGIKPKEMDKIPTLRCCLSTLCPSLSCYLKTLVREYSGQLLLW